MAMDLAPGKLTARLRRLRGTLTLRNAYDLLLLAGGALLLPGLLTLPASLLSLPVGLLRVPLGLALVLLAPGYALVAALFPARPDLEGVERAALSLGLSIATMPVLALLLDTMRWGIRPWPMALSLSAWIGLLCAVAALRRRTLAPAAIPPLPAFNIRRGAQPAGSRPDKRGRWVLLAAGAGLVVALAITLLSLDPTAHTTEFYVVGREGQAENYPQTIQFGETVTATVGIIDHERGYDTRTYRIEVWNVDRWNPAQRELLSRPDPILLGPGQTREGVVNWRMPRTGSDQQVEILLFAGNGSEPYRRLRLWLNVVDQPPRQ
jgi:uncharacterized membrane protein